MIYTLPVRNPDLGYRDTWLWLPKKRISVEVVKNSLTVPVRVKDDVVYMTLWRDAPHHLGIPREKIKIENLSYPVVDLTPESYERVRFHSKVVLDYIQPKKDEQRRAFQDMSVANSGILNLACVSGDTRINFNRGGRGFTMSVEKAYQRFHGLGRYFWDDSIGTYVRSKQGEQIGLHELKDIVLTGTRQTTTIRLVDGKSIRLTADHRVLTSRGWVEAQHISIGDEVITDGAVLPGRKPKPKYRRLSWYPSHPFVRVQNRKNRKSPGYQIEEHRVVAEAALNGLTLDQFRERCRIGDVAGLQFLDPEHFHVHHDDENTSNNDPSNLIVTPRYQHLEQHRPGYAAFGQGVPVPVRVVAIEAGRFEPVYDLVCKAPHHNFVANGIVVHNCGKGKTIIALHHIAQRGVPALIINDKTHILQQWIKEIRRFLVVPGELGWIQGNPNKWTWKRPIVLASLKSLAMYADQVPPEMTTWFGTIIWDEIHHLSADEFSKTADMFYGDRFGVTATVERDDGGEMLYLWHVGNVIHKNLKQDVIPSVTFFKSDVRLDMNDPDTFRACTDRTGEIHVRRLANYVGTRPEEIAFERRVIDEGVKQDRDILAVTLSKEHAQLLHELYPGSGVLHQGIPAKDRLDVLKNSRLTFATVDMAKEALNKQKLDALIILTEFSSKNILQQSVGRIQRYLDGKKKTKVIVIWHENVMVMRNMGYKLMNHFKRWGIKVVVK